jgi:phosphohistidine phosphatase
LELYLIRHAHALDGPADATRPLSDRGRKQIRTVARCLKRAKVFTPVEIWHSPLVRARDTAGLLVQRLGLRVRVREMPGLTPHDEPGPLRRRLRLRQRPLAIVGHEPQLSALASLLIAGSAAPPVIILKKCAVVALGRENGRWALRWHLPPELLRR